MKKISLFLILGTIFLVHVQKKTGDVTFWQQQTVGMATVVDGNSANITSEYNSAPIVEHLAVLYLIT